MHRVKKIKNCHGEQSLVIIEMGTKFGHFIHIPGKFPDFTEFEQIQG